jgi:hypothetical protein
MAARILTLNAVVVALLHKSPLQQNLILSVGVQSLPPLPRLSVFKIGSTNFYRRKHKIIEEDFQIQLYILDNTRHLQR